MEWARLEVEMSLFHQENGPQTWIIAFFMLPLPSEKS